MATWKWNKNVWPELRNSVDEYGVTGEVRERYEEELDHWIASGWVVKYD